MTDFILTWAIITAGLYLMHIVTRFIYCPKNKK